MIAIDMGMPSNCVECRFGQGDYGFCHAMPENFCGYVYESEDEGRPNWCPLKHVDKLMVEHIIQQEGIERYGKDVVKNYLASETSKKLGDKIVEDAMCKWEKESIDPYIMPFANRIRATVCVVRPDTVGGCSLE